MFATISMTVDIPVYPERVYRAWLDSYEHSRFTDHPVSISGRVGEPFSTLDGKVAGVTQVSTPFDRIVQTWNLAEFPHNQPDSILELTFEPTCTGSQVKVTQTGVEAGSTRQMMQWWEDHYLRPLRDYFDELVGDYPADEGDG
ncbi:MAG: SRPBCC domain-containing protein [Bellilinea sp.]